MRVHNGEGLSLGHGWESLVVLEASPTHLGKDSVPTPSLRQYLSIDSYNEYSGTGPHDNCYHYMWNRIWTVNMT